MITVDQFKYIRPVIIRDSAPTIPPPKNGGIVPPWLQYPITILPVPGEGDWK